MTFATKVLTWTTTVLIIATLVATIAFTAMGHEVMMVAEAAHSHHHALAHLRHRF